MKNTYFLSLNILKVNEAEFLKDFARQLDELGIKNKQKLEETGKIETLYQNEPYLLSLENHVNFPHILKINTNLECTTNQGGFITLIRRILNWKYGIEYGDMEFFSDETFRLVNKRYHLRFINYKVLHQIIDSIKVIEPIEFEEYENEGAYIKQAKISCKNYSAEQVWISIAKALDYDGWDTVNREFVPLTLDEYYLETKKFAEIWNIEPKKYYLKITSIPLILRLSESWDSNEYLIKTDEYFHYISTDNCTG